MSMSDTNDPWSSYGINPSSPRPGADWVPTQDGQGWVQPSHPLAWKAPTVTPPATPTLPPVAPPVNPPERVAGPVITDPPYDPSKTATSIPATPPPPVSGGNREVTPNLGPLVANPDGTATHDPSVPMPGPTTPSPSPAPTPSPAPPAPPTWDPPSGTSIPIPNTPVSSIPAVPQFDLAAYKRNAEKTALIEQLMRRAGQSLDVTNDPLIHRQTDQYSAQQERARRDYLSQQAETLGPTATGALRGQARMTAEDMGQNVGKFESDLMQRELTSRRQEIQQALDSMGGLLSDEDKNGLQRELASLDASIQGTKMNVENTQFYANLNQNEKNFVRTLQQGERFHNMDDALRRFELNQQESQFIRNLAQTGDLAKLQMTLEQSKMSQQDKQFMLDLAQKGQFEELELAYKKSQLSQDNNQFIAELAQKGKLAELDDMFRKMQLMQQHGEFLDRLGFDVNDRSRYWDSQASGKTGN